MRTPFRPFRPHIPPPPRNSLERSTHHPVPQGVRVPFTLWYNAGFSPVEWVNNAGETVYWSTSS